MKIINNKRTGEFCEKEEKVKLTAAHFFIESFGTEFVEFQSLFNHQEPPDFKTQMTFGRIFLSCIETNNNNW